MRTFHILNGDSLKSQFPEQLHGEKIVARECLVDGPVEGFKLDDLYETRWRFINDNYGDCPKEIYFRETVAEFEKIQNIERNSEINLWFEDDLFCQVNFWFVINLVYKDFREQKVFLIRPKINSEYSFGSMNGQELVTAFHNKVKIELLEMELLSQLWILYQQSDFEEMIEIALELNDRFPFLEAAIDAHRERFPQNGTIGRPKLSLLQITKELGSNDFGKVFQAFCKRESIYGFGDLQVRRLLDEILHIKNDTSA